MPRRAWVLALVSGALQVLCFPAPSLYLLCWVALAPLMLAVLAPAHPGKPQLIDKHGHPLSEFGLGGAFLLGYASGIVWYGGTCYWVFHVMHTYGGLSAPVAAGILVLFCLYLALYHGLFALLLKLAQRHSLRRALLLAPFLWVAVELARAHVTGFPWDLLGTAQVDNIPLAHLARFGGVYVISFGIALVNTAFAAAWLLPWERGKTLNFAAFTVAVVLQLGIVIRPEPAKATEAALLVQQDLPITDQPWDYPYYVRTLTELQQISAFPPGTPQEHAKLIVWPESPAPFYTNDPTFIGAMSTLAQVRQAYVIAGSLGVKGTAPKAELKNSAVLVDPTGRWVARYDKNHLVPFGEYVPFQSVFVFASKLTKEVGDFTPGTERTVFDAGGQKAGVFICYESIFPDEVRLFVKNGAQVLVNISNDGWFGRYGAPQQHLNMARMRAIENERWVLRDTDSGITAAIDPDGRVVDTAPRDKRLALVAPYALISRTTFYTEHGDWFAWACVIIALIGLLVRIRARTWYVTEE